MGTWVLLSPCPSCVSVSPQATKGHEAGVSPCPSHVPMGTPQGHGARCPHVPLTSPCPSRVSTSPGDTGEPLGTWTRGVPMSPLCHCRAVSPPSSRSVPEDADQGCPPRPFCPLCDIDPGRPCPSRVMARTCHRGVLVPSWSPLSPQGTQIWGVPMSLLVSPCPPRDPWGHEAGVSLSPCVPMSPRDMELGCPHVPPASPCPLGTLGTPGDMALGCPCPSHVPP